LTPGTGLQLPDHTVFGCGQLLQFAGNLRLDQLDGVVLALFGKLESVVQLLLEIAIANLLQDVRVPRLVYLHLS
jgi:hypothetical protein